MEGSSISKRKQCNYCGMSWTAYVWTDRFACPSCGAVNIVEVEMDEKMRGDKLLYNQPAVAKAVYKDGAVRSARKPRYDKIPTAGLRRIAERYGMGCDNPNYAPDGDNWKNGGEDFWRDAGNHAFEHLKLYLDGDRSDDHLAAVGWYITSRCWYEDQTSAQSEAKCKAQQALK
jgi:predicted RNA-binding Zn-ribbon protein involved in translation (DUF1610 family)